MIQFHDIDLAELRVLLCDADGNLFPSEEPAFVASAEVTNAFLSTYGAPGTLTAEQLRLGTTGKNFRTTAVDLCVAHGVPVEPAVAGSRPQAILATGPTVDGRAVLTAEALEHWVAEEKERVSAYLGEVLTPDRDVRDPLGKLAAHLALAAVSSSALGRLETCFVATDLAALIPGEQRYSAEDSLPVPTSKPDPAIYRHAGRELGCAGAQGLAVEDSVPGAQSAVAAGFPTVGNVMFVPEPERAERVEALRQAGVVAVVTSWWDLADLVLPTVGAP
uniref:HAD-IA family hydrolase n=1 Tax=Micromonospora acroterricola TaxID=2202421 RepID=UPI00191C51F4|nr:HAD family hydrolase [Micromonospora acroterricola]